MATTGTPTTPVNTVTSTSALGDDAAALVTAIKAGWRTSEFWITLAVVGVGTLLASNVLGDGSIATKIVGGAMATLKAGAYTWSRTQVKS